MEKAVEKKDKKTKVGFLNLEEVLKRKVIAKIFGLQIYTKTITLIAGQSLVGKTVTCMHFANDCVIQGKDVLYFDTDSHPIACRPNPNLLKTFSAKSPKQYAAHVQYTNSFDPGAFIEAIEQHKPSLVILDSIYAPFSALFPYAKERAKRIRQFLMDVREVIFKHDIALIVTSQVSKDYKGDDMMYNVLGGEGLKHCSDTKWILDFVGNGEAKPGKVGARLLMIDKQEQVKVIIGYGGVIDKID